FRLLLADVVVVTMAEAGSEWERTYDAVKTVVPSEVDVVPTVLRPRPMTSVRERKVAYFCTAPPGAHDVIAEHLEAEHGADVVHVSGSLADRNALQG
ncbi:MAG: 2,3-diphosphoglycerate synthetase, partial [Actinobacteria bacterium]|nr:2,3-diphosphoglycerate synthetase [Actinomycetota bacterium]